MSDKKHLAVEANKKSIKYAMEGNREAWLDLYTEDAVVQDPVGVSPMDPSGKGHRGKEAIAAFWDNVIGKSKLDIRVDKRWTSGDYRCCVAQVAHNDLGDGKVSKCDYCMERLDKGLKPACVTKCITQCLHFGAAGEEEMQQRRQQFAKTVASFDG